MTNFAAVSPGEFKVPLELTNLGLEEAISVPYTLNFVAADGTVYQGATGTVSGIPGLSDETVNQLMVIPTNPALPAGVYQLQLVIGVGVPADLNMGNNVILGIQRVVNGQDMTASIISVPFSIATPTTFTVPVEFRTTWACRRPRISRGSCSSPAPMARPTSRSPAARSTWPA